MRFHFEYMTRLMLGTLLCLCSVCTPVFATNIAPTYSSQLLMAKGPTALGWQDELQHAEALIQEGKPDSAKQLLTHIIEISRENGELAREHAAIGKLAVAYYYLSNYDSAIWLGSKCLDYYDAQKDFEQVANITNLISYAYSKKGWYEESLNFRLMALELRQQLQDTVEISKSLVSLGDFYYEQGNYYQAEKYYSQALESSKANNNQRGVAISNYKLATVFRENGDLERSLFYHLTALKLKRKLGITREVILSLEGLGKLQAELGLYGEANKHLKEALEFAKSNSDRYTIAQVYAHFAYVHKLQENYPKMLQYLDKAYSYANEIDNYQLLLEILNDKATAFMFLNQQDSFFAVHQQIAQVQDLMANNQINSNKITEIQQRFEEEKREKIIRSFKEENEIQKELIANAERQRITYIILISISTMTLVLIFLLYNNKLQSNRELQKRNSVIEEKNTQLEQYGEELKSINQTKDKLLAIISHDIRSPLNSLTSVVELMDQQVNALSTEELSEIFTKTKIRLHKLEEFLNNLLRWAQIQNHSFVHRPIDFDAAERVQTVVELYQDMAYKKHLQLENKLPFPTPIHADQDMFDFVIRNLLNNAIKFSKTGGHIFFKQEDDLGDGLMRISIHDNGVGMNRDQIDAIFNLNKQITEKGTSAEKGTGLGLLTSNEFLNINNGKLEVESQKGIGSKFTICLPQAVLQGQQ